VFARAKEERGGEKKRKRKADSMEQRGEGYGRHSETVERGMDGRTDDGRSGGGERERGKERERERERERKRRLGGAAARRPAANCQTTAAVPQAVPPSSRRPLTAPMIKTHHGFSATTRTRANVSRYSLVETRASARVRKRDFEKAYHRGRKR